MKILIQKFVAIVFMANASIGFCQTSGMSQMDKLKEFANQTCKSGTKNMSDNSTNPTVAMWRTKSWGKGYSYCTGFDFSRAVLSKEMDVDLNTQMKYLTVFAACDGIQYGSSQEAFKAGWMRLLEINRANNSKEFTEVMELCRPLSPDLNKMLTYEQKYLVNK
ncbi:hypothetical protein [Polynucleobacter sp. AP-Titi-500A-B4]|uniref:hypothetical protein n=1 Tax=Polynucleobacter sp. AP-Titi-500A-B4 TaxID=2576923 RepID=UPI001BFD8577|nr:hypothetical protein [Polynucleobacter sp. AP-Titi-500A-B4]QWE12490.1 hypothetical protein FD968_10380 [Polynucleobacter sp. AP-Titi-500A-B4]